MVASQIAYLVKDAFMFLYTKKYIKRQPITTLVNKYKPESKLESVFLNISMYR